MNYLFFAVVRAWALCLCVLFSLSGGATVAAASDAEAARACILAARDAVDAADVKAFEAAVDVDLVLERAVAVVAEVSARGGEQTPPVLALMFSPLSDAPAARRLLAREAGAFVRNGIASGAFAGRRKADAPAAQGVLAPLFADVSMGRKQITRVSSPVRSDGGAWLVAFDLFDGGNQETYSVLGRVERQGTRLRLTAVENMKDIFRRLCKEFAAREE